MFLMKLLLSLKYDNRKKKDIFNSNFQTKNEFGLTLGYFDYAV